MRSGQETPKRNLSETRSNNSAVVPIHCSSKLCSQQAPSLERQATPHAAVAHLPEAWVAAEYAHVVKHGHLSPLVGACELRARECIVPAAHTHTHTECASAQPVHLCEANRAGMRGVGAMAPINRRDMERRSARHALKRTRRAAHGKMGKRAARSSESRRRPRQAATCCLSG